MWVLPPGGNEKIKGNNDSGAGVYVVFKSPFLKKKIIKYVWSSTLQVGTRTVSPHFSKVKIKVIRSGNDSLGIWIEERVNVFQDFEEFFNSSPPIVEVIAIMSDSDNTKSFTLADYDDFYACEKK